MFGFQTPCLVSNSFLFGFKQQQHFLGSNRGEEVSDLLSRFEGCVPDDTSGSALQVGAMPQVFTPFNGWEDFDPSNTLVLTARDGEPLMLTAQQVQQLTWDEFKDLWRVGGFGSVFLMSCLFVVLSCPLRSFLCFFAEQFPFLCCCPDTAMGEKRKGSLSSSNR